MVTEVTVSSPSLPISHILRQPQDILQTINDNMFPALLDSSLLT